jgi:hypothetical protein
MAANRIYRSQSVAQRFSTSAPMTGVHTAQPASAPSVPHGFVVCPLAMLATGGWQQEIYRLAYERAKAAAEVPRHHRRLFSVWN